MDFDPAKSDRVFTVILPDPLEISILPKIIKLICDENYRVRFATFPLFGSDITEAVTKNRVDLALSPNPLFEIEVNSSFLFSEEVCIICRKDHPEFAHVSDFTLRDMERVKLIAIDESLRRLTHLEYEMRERKLQRDIICTVTRMSSLPNLVTNSDAVAVVTQSMADALRDRFDLKSFKLPIERPDQQWHMAWRRSNDSDPGHNWLRKKIIDLTSPT